MGNRFPILTLTLLKVLVGISLACLLSALFISSRAPTIREFLVGAATGILITTFATLLSLHSVTTKDEVEAQDSEIQSLRLN
jgi:uncharacterized membrane protein YgaE (UPF0421/DUF939 family)